jgi:hypothetical protein
MDYFGSTQYCLSEGWHELEIPQYVGWWSINSVYQDNNYIQGATADFWFYVGGSDTTIYCWYTF